MFCQSLFVWCVNHLLKKTKQRSISNTKINNWALALLQINHQKNTFCLKNESIYLLLLGRSKMFDSIISKRLIRPPFHVFHQQLFHVALSVKCWEDTGYTYKTNAVAKQGDCFECKSMYILCWKSAPIIYTKLLNHEYMQSTIHTLFDGLFQQNYSVIMQSLQIDIGTQYADNISKISSNYLQ